MASNPPTNDPRPSESRHSSENDQSGGPQSTEEQPPMEGTSPYQYPGPRDTDVESNEAARSPEVPRDR